ncbi:MAG: hypothetical protein WCR27_05185 [Eubacteriales bacterium]
MNIKTKKIKGMGSMKKLFLLTLVLVMTLSFAGCGGDTTPTISLVDVTTDQGISMKLPSDMAVQEGGMYANTETADVASFGVADIGGTPLSSWKEENVLATYQSNYKNVVIKSFENGKQINGKEALVSTFSLTTTKGNDVIGALIMITDGEKNYVVNLFYGSDNTDGSLAQNQDACIESINIK